MDALLEQYARDGHVIIDNALSTSLVAELNAIVDARLANEKDPEEDYIAGFEKYRFRGGGLHPGVSDAAADGERDYSNERRLRYDPPPTGHATDWITTTWTSKGATSPARTAVGRAIATCMAISPTTTSQLSTS
jgi:hypothetical protein